MNESIEVLVVDDDPVAIAVVDGHLAHEGIEVRSASCVADALAMLAVGPLPDVIVSDVMMPGDDGFELCRAVRADEGLSHLPFLFVTAAGDRASRIRALDGGADDLLAKPVDDVELVARVRSLARLSRSRYALRQRERADAILGRIGDGVLTLDLDGRVADANAVAVRLLQLPDDDSADRTSLTAYLSAAGFVDDPTLTPGSPATPGGRSRRMVRPSVAGGADLYVDIFEEPVAGVSGRVEAHLVVIRDVSDHQRATRASDLIVSSIAHKFRTPLTGLRGALEMFAMTEPSDTQTTLVDLMHSSLERLDVSLMRVLEFANAAVDETEPPRAALCPESVTRTLVDLLDGQHAEVLRRADVYVRDAVEVPAGPLALVLQELLDNAVAAGGGPATVTVRIVGGPRDLTVIVEDDGPGFPPEDAERMFDRFFQSDRSGQRDGMGLGLPLVRHVVEAAGGTVTARSRPGEPTRFTALIPHRGATSDQAA